jgi:hypothetical protein
MGIVSNLLTDFSHLQTRRVRIKIARAITKMPRATIIATIKYATGNEKPPA